MVNKIIDLENASRDLFCVACDTFFPLLSVHFLESVSILSQVMQFFVSLVVVRLKSPLLFGDYDFIKVGFKDIKLVFGDLGRGNVGKMRLIDD